MDDISGGPPQPEVEVRVLGPVSIAGAARPFSRAGSRDLVVYLALHPRGVPNDQWATALWPDRAMSPATLHSTASAARRALGTSRGGDDHLPRSHGQLRLAGSVTSDWRRFTVLSHSADPADWVAALLLVRGPAFLGLRQVDPQPLGRKDPGPALSWQASLHPDTVEVYRALSRRPLPALGSTLAKL
jgi:hypothetical protein